MNGTFSQDCLYCAICQKFIIQGIYNCESLLEQFHKVLEIEHPLQSMQMMKMMKL